MSTSCSTSTDGAHPEGKLPDAPPCRGMIRLHSGDFFGIDGRPVEVQVDVSSRGSPGFAIVGLAGPSIRESRERIRTAISNSGFLFPFKERILVNLAPAAQEKHGSGFDLAIALGILLASGQARAPGGLLRADGLLVGLGCVGELGLNGELRRVPGVLLVAHALRARGVERLIVPEGNAREASLVEGVGALPAADIHSALAALDPTTQPQPVPWQGFAPGESCPADSAVARNVAMLDYAEVRGQEATKRGLLVAASGGHNALLCGPPGTGKTMLARRLPGILPAMTFEEALDVTRIASVLGQEINDRLEEARPFRAPHHTVSYTGLVGGGSRLRPGEVTRAHRGVLFLDEFPEFNRQALEALREPLEQGHISIGRSSGCVTFPASFLLVAAMNPCPCGYLGHSRRACNCTEHEVRAYRQRISGPLLDRIDIHLLVGAVDPAELAARESRGTSLSSQVLRERVAAARRAQERRWGAGQCNGSIALSRLLSAGQARRGALERLTACTERLGLSGRSFVRTLRLARTVADLEESVQVEVSHVEEALMYRQNHT